MMFDWSKFIGAILLIVLISGGVGATYGLLVLLENRRFFAGAAVFIAFVLVFATVVGFITADR
jgi:hypothetical protein